MVRDALKNIFDAYLCKNMLFPLCLCHTHAMFMLNIFVHDYGQMNVNGISGGEDF